MTSPAPTPAATPPAVSMAASGPRSTCSRSAFAAAPAPICTIEPPISAPMSPARPARASAAVLQSTGASRDPITAPTAKPARPRNVAMRPRCAPRKADRPPPRARGRRWRSSVMYTPRPAPQVRVCARLRRWSSCTSSTIQRCAVRISWPRSGAGTTRAGRPASPRAYLRAVTDAERCAVIDSELFIDYQQTRPTVELVDGDVAGSTGPRPRSTHPRSRTWSSSSAPSRHALAASRAPSPTSRGATGSTSSSRWGRSWPTRRTPGRARLGDGLGRRADGAVRPRAIDVRGADGDRGGAA